MAKRGKSERIEPSFEGSKARGELSVSESDRVVPAARGKGKAPSRLILQASADLAQQQATKAIRTRNTVTTAEARA